MLASGFVPLPFTSQPRGSLTLTWLSSALTVSPVAACKRSVACNAAAPATSWLQRGCSSSALCSAGPCRHHLLGLKSPSAHPRIRDRGLAAECWKLAEAFWDKYSGIIFMWDKLCGAASGQRSHPLLQFTPMLIGCQVLRQVCGRTRRGFPANSQLLLALTLV